ncbi:MAG: 5'/3'-nucleotidase SurE [Gammaproteobacteria bacterium]|jgi:5'-nucleotidase|nr:5'/3'-nucleotidase SurE [Gammaproteobacteria bacterium]
MKILLSNDDGYHAQGLAVLAAALREIAEVEIVAPDRNQSGSSHSLTLGVPLRAGRTADGVWYVNGTPTDCVHMAITGFLDYEPDMVVSGINHGANLGDDVLYSGTVAAAIEGRFLGLPAIAVSLVGEDPLHFPTAARATAELIVRLGKRPLPADTILNVNVPDLPYDSLGGFRATRLGFRHRAEPVVRAVDPKGKPVYWVGPAGAGQDAGPGTDFAAVADGFVSVTPLQVDLTRHDAIAGLQDWLTEND